MNSEIIDITNEHHNATKEEKTLKFHHLNRTIKTYYSLAKTGYRLGVHECHG